MAEKRSKSTGTDWTTIRLRFVHQNATLADLAEQHGLKLDTISKRAQRDGWYDERAKAEQEAYAAAAAKAAKDRAKDLADFNRDDLKIAKAVRARVAQKLANATAKMTASELRQLAGAAETAQRVGRLALGASTDNFGHGGAGGEGPVKIEMEQVNADADAFTRAIAALAAREKEG